MKTYLDLLHRVRTEGVLKEDRTGTGTLSVFGHQMRFDLNAGFPLLTTKRVHVRSVVAELLWFLRGATNVDWLHQQGVTIWDEWADPEGELGPIYGYQWRSWPTPDGRHVDQIAAVIDSIRSNPDSRRHLVNAWNVGELDQMALPPCHTMFQFYVAPGPNGRGRLSCQLYQRSGDVFLGVPFNIASYALLTHLVAQVCDLEVGDFVHTLGDAHLYLNHLEQADLQLQRRAATVADPAARSHDHRHRRLPPGGHHDRGVRPVPVDQGADRGLSGVTESEVPTGPPVVAIAAVARNGVIGNGTDIPWRIPEDWRRFQRLTMGEPLIMGRKTYDSIGRPLPGRRTIVVTRDPGWSAAGVEVAASWEDALERARRHQPKTIYVAGGGEIYRAAWAALDRLEITEVDVEPEGEVTFPPIPTRDWELTAREPRTGFAFVTYSRRSDKPW